MLAIREHGRLLTQKSLQPSDLQVYFDDLTKSRAGTLKNTKISVVYLTISNLPYEAQSKRDQILLSLICKRKDLIDRAGLVEFFDPLKNSMNEMNRNPIELNNGYKIQVVVSSVVADNPASNELHGICMSFRWDACRSCIVFLAEIRANNIDNYQEIVDGRRRRF